MILFEFLDPDCDSGSDDEDDNPLPSDGKWVNSIKVIGIPKFEKEYQIRIRVGFKMY